MGDTFLKICGFHPFRTTWECPEKVLRADPNGGFYKRTRVNLLSMNFWNEYEDGHALLTVDFSNAYNTPQRTAIAQALLQNSIFKPFMRTVLSGIWDPLRATLFC